MGTTNILDLNNRLEKVEKENIAQNSYTSLKNKPKINSVILTGNKTSADLGIADASDVNGLQTEIGDLTTLNTTVKTDVVSAINEVNGRVDAYIISESVNVKGEQSYTIPSDGYLRLANNSSTSGDALIKLNTFNILKASYDKMGAYDLTTIFVKKGMVLTDSSTLDNYYLNYNSLT